MPCEDCPMEQRIIMLEKDSERNQETHKGYYSSFERLAIENAVAVHKFTSIMSAIDELKNKVDSLVSKPAKRWESIVLSALSALIGGVIGKYLLGG